MARMESNIIGFIDYKNRNMISDDGIWTQGKLIDKIQVIVHRVNISNDSDSDIAEFIENSFSINGILHTYNQLGYYGWYKMISQMIEHEVYERCEQICQQN